MKRSILAALIATTTFNASAALSDADMTAVKTYLGQFNNVPSYVIGALTDGANTLTDVNYRLKGNSYYDGSKVVSLEGVVSVQTQPQQPQNNARDTAQDAQIEANKTSITKVSDGLTAETKARKEADDQLSQRVDAKADKTALDSETAARQKADNALASTVVAEEAARVNGDANLQTQVDTNKQDIASNKANIDKKVDQGEFNDHVTLQQARDGGQDNAIAAEAATRQKADSQHTADIAANKTAIADRATKAELATGLSQKVDSATFSQRSAVVDSRFADTDARIAEQKASQAKVNKAVASTLDNHEGRITDLERNSNKGFAELKNQIDKNAKKANAGTSTALAAAGIPQVTGDQRFTLGAATGGYEGEQALAVGFSARVSSNVTVKASVGTDTQHGVGYNAGVAVGW